jgi:TRAP-type C4-dicarboxylate transport system substrate-binding protein
MNPGGTLKGGSLMKGNIGNALRLGQIVVLGLAFFFGSWVGHVATSHAEPITLTLSSWDSENGSSVPAWKQMIKDLEAFTKGGVKIKVFYSQALGKAKEHYEMAAKGIADICFINTGFTPGRFPLNELPAFSTVPSAVMNGKGLLEIMKKGYLDKEYAGVKLLHVYSSSPSQFIWRKGVKGAANLEDLKGKKIRVPSTGAANLLKALGASPVAIPMPEVYTALERGVIDGTFTSLDVLDAFSLSQVCDQVTIADGPAFGFSLVMNVKAWDGLSPEVKGFFEKTTPKYVEIVGRTFDEQDELSLKRHSPKIYRLSPAEKQLIKNELSTELKKYIQKYDELGFPAMKAAEVFFDVIKSEYKIEPFNLAK